MNLPFGLPVKETGVKKKENYADAVTQYEHKLAEYKEVLETYRKYIKEYSIRLENYERKYRESQLDNVQSALDITYLKEQGDKAVELLHQLKAATGLKPNMNLDLITTSLEEVDQKLDELEKDLKQREESLNDLNKNMLTMAINLDNMDKRMEALCANVDGLDKNAVNRLTEFLLELQKQHLYQNRQLQTEVLAEIERLDHSTNKNKVMLWFILIFNIFGVISIFFMVLYYLEIIPL